VGEIETFGWKNADSKTPIRQDTVFEAASLGKPVVSYAVLKLVDKHLIQLDDPVSKYIDSPELHEDPRWKDLTIRMLLDHTSGLPNELPTGEKIQFLFQPGTRFSYSGNGFSVLQQVIEKVTQKPFEEFVEESVFKPLQMRSSSFVWREIYDSQKAN